MSPEHSVGEKKGRVPILLLSAVLLTLAAGGTAFLAKYDPSGFPVNLCPFNNLTGLPCCTCGGTRAMHALLNGDVPAALRYNLYVTLLLLPGFACLGVSAGIFLFTGRENCLKALLKYLLPALLVCGGVFGLARILPTPVGKYIEIPESGKESGQKVCKKPLLVLFYRFNDNSR